jgi:peroxiredoxin
VSSGTLEENVEKIAPVFGGSILIDPDRRLALSLRAKWTPTALFMNSDGRVASFLAAGDASIRSLTDRIRDEHPEKPSAYFADDTEDRSKIGERVPEFSLYAHDNRLVTESELIGARSLVVFWSPLCPHCQIMMSELRSWDATRRHDDPRLFVFSNGDSELHRELGLESPVLADPDHATAAKLGMYGTPSAVLINERGEIASETATGIDNIWALIGKRK